MRRVYKYGLRAVADQEVEMPFGAVILSAHQQHGTICIWALVNPDEKTMTSRSIHLGGTGHEIPNGNLDFIDTVHMWNGSVIHVFEVEP